MLLRAEALAMVLAALLASCSGPAKKAAGFRAVETNVAIGGRKAVTLSQANTLGRNEPQILSVDLLPGRGMNIFQIRAFLPERGEVDLIESPSLEAAAGLMNGGADDAYASQSYKLGGAILLPFANRIRGKVSADGKTLETDVAGKTVKLDANSKGKNPGAEPHAMHGLILGTPMDKVDLASGPDSATATATLNAGDFGGHWVSQTALTIQASLRHNFFRFDVTAKNAGSEPLPMGIGWHPYFRFPSGERAQGRLHIPASERALVDNYDNVFPTGKLVPLAGTPYDFSQPQGAPLDRLFLDDCFVNLTRNRDGQAVADIADPKAAYGLRIRALSPEITAFQAYAPVEKSFVAFEPQFNWADPFSKLWNGQPTGMKILKPGESVTYSVQLELYVP